jgi:hypothetical protein
MALKLALGLLRHLDEDSVAFLNDFVEQGVCDVCKQRRQVFPVDVDDEDMEALVWCRSCEQEYWDAGVGVPQTVDEVERVGIIKSK